MRILVRVVVLALLVGGFLMSDLAWAQGTPTGSIRGVVRDETGAVVPGATVVATSRDTGVEVRRATSGPDGVFTLDLMPVGNYDVAITAPNFARYQAAAVQVRVTEATNLPVTMRVGAVEQEVTVTAAAAPVQLNQPTMGQTVTNVGDIPLATRNFLQILALSTGANTDMPDTAALGRGVPSIEVNGNRASDNNFTIEGMNANDFNLPQFTNVPVPNPSAVAEFRTQTSLYTAEYGRNPGGNINVALKSGTQRFHGDLFYFFRNEKLNANDFFLNSAGQARPLLRQNQFGGSIGGPIPILPDFFFFGNYQGTRQLSGMAAGTQLNSLIASIPVDRSAGSLASAFGVPAGSIHPVSLALLNLKGNHLGDFPGGFLIPSVPDEEAGQGRLVISRPGRFREDQGVVNLDKNFGANHKVFGRGFFSDNLTNRPWVSDSAFTLPQPRLSPGKNWFATLGYTMVAGPTMVNDARFGFNRFFFANVPTELVSLSDLGMTRANSASFGGAPGFIVQGTGFSFGTGVNDDRGGAFNTFSFNDTLSWTRGNHALRFGGSVDRYQLNRYNRFATRGTVTFASFQDFLRGNIRTTQGGAGFFDFYFRNTDYSFFVQDDWKVTPRLTVNLGLRWEPFGIAHEKFNRLTNLGGLGEPGPVQFVFPEELELRGLGTQGVSRCTYQDCRFWENLAPRFGFAWDPTGTGSWAVRGGYGIYYHRFSNQTLLQSTGGGVFSQAVSGTGTPLANPFPTLRPQSDFPLDPIQPPQLVSVADGGAGAPTFTSADLPGFSFFGIRNLRTPYAQQWNLTVQRSFANNWMAEIGYVGNKGTALLFGHAYNQAMLASPSNPIVQPLAGGGTVTITENTLANRSARVPTRWLGFPVGRLLPQTNDGFSNYHSLQTSVVRRFGANYFQAAYTWSKAIDNGSGSQADLGDELNGLAVFNGDPRFGRALADFDRTHRFVLSYAYEFPWLKNATGITRALLGGWGTNAVITFQSGNPFSVIDSSGGSLQGLDICCFVTARMAPGRTYESAEKEGDVKDRLNEYFDTSAFTPAGDIVGGNSGRNILRGPFQQNWDMSLFKRFYITERTNLEFRTEAFNIWNHPVFAAPGCGVGACSLPVVDIQEGTGAGTISSTANRPRILQFVLKLNW